MAQLFTTAKKDTTFSLYGRYVDAFVEKNSGGEKSREVVVREAQSAWKSVKDDSSKANEYIANVQKWKSQQAEGGEGTTCSSLWLGSVSSSYKAATLGSGCEPEPVTSASAMGTVELLLMCKAQLLQAQWPRPKVLGDLSRTSSKRLVSVQRSC